ncbi:hypothetical protein [Ferrovibrio sp.]|uniref:hypothetical protein n=1 Tax=Ferrovibrio sp. TaxID=1917215 RepID=UPI00311E570B
MSESKHTKGPYLRDGALVYALNEDGTNRFCAYVQVGFVEQPRRGAAVRTTTEEAQATAALFAAAPDLLAALEEAEEGLASSYQVCDYPANGRSQQDRALASVRAALARAKGGDV